MNKKKSKLIDNRGEKIYPYAKASRFFSGATKLFMILALIVVVVHYLSVGIVWLVKKVSEGLSSLDLNNIDPTTDPLGLTGMLSGYPHWVNNVSRFFLKLHLFDFLTVFLSIMVACFVYWTITIVLRHHYGEQAPFLNDRESKKMKKEIIEALDVNFDGSEIVNDTEAKKKKRRITKTEQLINDAIKSADVQIHTRVDLKDGRAYKEYKIKVPQPKSNKVRGGVLNLIKDLDAVLTGVTGGEVAFGKMENEVSRENFIFRGNIEVERKIAKSVRKKQEQEEKKQSKQANKKTEWAFPLELYENRTEKIASQTQLATSFAEEQKNSVDVIIIGSDIQATMESMFVGNTSVQYVYKTAWDRKTTSKVANLEEVMESMLKIRGIQVSLNAGEIEITIPLPNDENRNYTIPIDVRTMIEKAYGYS